MIAAFVEVLGAGIGNLLNPATVAAGYILSKQSPKTSRFWFYFFVAILACLGIQLGLERLEGLPSYSAPFWFVVEAISIGIWTLVWSMVRKFRSPGYSQQEGGWE